MRYALASSLVLALIFGTGEAAVACSCVPNPTAETILDEAAAVFTGVAQDSATTEPDQSVTTFTVVESFKGPGAGATVRVLHPSGSSASCGVKFSSGQTYTLASYRVEPGPGLSTSLCSTWMFAPQVGTSVDLIRRMREIRDSR